MYKNSNYTFNKHALYGMMSNRNYLFEDDPNLSYYVMHKNRNKVFVFPKGNSNIKLKSIVKFFQNNLDVKKVCLQYITQCNFKALEQELKTASVKFGKSKSTLLLSSLSSDWFKLPGKKHSEIREARNSFSKKFYYLVNEPIEILQPRIDNLISWWDENRGYKYGWQRHSGYDKAFFKNWYSKKPDDFICLSFYDKKSDKFIGYSVVSTFIHDVNKKNCITYIIRKCDTSKRNTSLYIDYITFEYANKALINTDQFYVSWGASSGGVLLYKKSKFPVGIEERSNFLTIKREDLLNDKK